MGGVYCADLPNVMHEMMDGEVVIIDLESGAYFSFDGAGAQIWTMLTEGGRGLEDLVQGVSSRFEGEAASVASAVEDFVGHLAREGLIRVIDEPSGTFIGTGAVERGDALPAFVAPVLNKYTDMQSLLLADPIHEVEDQGWPHLK